MTITEALQAEVEYQNTNIVEKILLDVLPTGIAGSTTYVSATHKDYVSEGAAYLMRAAARSPEFKESSRFIKYNASALLREAKSILVSLGIETAGNPSIKSGGIYI